MYHRDHPSRKITYIFKSELEYLAGINLSLQVIYLIRWELMKEIKLIIEK